MSSRGRRYSKPILVNDDEDGVVRRSEGGGSGTGGSGSGSGESKRGRPARKSRMVDITALLGLPQREAAARLGISESMLCKRYKETTRLKWPHRYLGKLNKKIALRQAKLPLLPADEDALAKLLAEKHKILQPVHIRLSDGDRDDKHRANHDDDEDDEDDEDNSDEQQQKKQQQKKKQKKSIELEDLDLESPESEVQLASVLVTLCSGS